MKGRKRTSEYIDKNEAVGEGYLADWYIHSVAEYDDEKLNEPRWTEKHIEELTQDFIVVPKDTPAADVAPALHGHWVHNPNGHDWNLGAWQCSLCHCTNNNLPYDGKMNPYMFSGAAYCPNCGARMEDPDHD